MNGGQVVQMSSSVALAAPPPPSSAASRSPPEPLQSQRPSSLSLGLLPLPLPLPLTPALATRHAAGPESAERAAAPMARVKLADITPYEGAPREEYFNSVEELSGSLMRHNAVVIELGSEEAVVLKCTLESARMCFKARAQCNGVAGGVAGLGKSGRGVCTYRAGRTLEDGDLSPACMGEAFRCMGNAARAALCAIARHLRLRSDVFNHLLDDTPLPANEVSSSVLIAACSHASYTNDKGQVGGKSSVTEVEKGLLTLIASDSPGIQVCDPNGRWYLADGGSGPGDLLLLTGRALSHATAGLRPAASYRTTVECCSSMMSRGRVSLTFKLMPQSNAILDCSPIEAAGHVTPQSYKPISVSQFMDDLSAEEDVMCNHPDNIYETQNNLIKESSLRSILSDPLSGAFLEDAVVFTCGHSFGGHMLKKVIEMARCSVCNEEIETGSLIPNFALRSAATTVKMEDDRRLFHNAALRKRRKEFGEQMEALKRLGKFQENGEMAAESDIPRQLKGVKYPFAVNEKVLIQGNKRTPDKLVGREAIITSQCLNGWYLLKILNSDESVRLQYRSLQKLSSSQADDRTQLQPFLQSSN